MDANRPCALGSAWPTARRESPDVLSVTEQGLMRASLPTSASHIYFPAELELLFLSAGFEITHQYGDYRFVPFDRTSPYVVTVARRPRRSRRRPSWRERHGAPQVGTSDLR
jgi:hypothetical protein